jgi:hypothetical protein
MYTNRAVGNRVIWGFGLLVFCKWQEHFYMFLHFAIRENCTAPDNNLKASSRHKAHLKEDFHPALQSYAHSLRNSYPSPPKCFINLQEVRTKHATECEFFFCNQYFKHKAYCTVSKENRTKFFTEPTILPCMTQASSPASTFSSLFHIHLSIYHQLYIVLETHGVVA